MQKYRQFFGFSLVCFFINLLTISCAETKVSQCKRVIDITKKIAQESENNRQTKDVQKVLQVADSFEEAAQDMEATKIQDEQLAKYKDGFAQVYQGHAQSTRDFVAALQQKDVPAAKLAQKRVQEIGKTEQKLVIEMNRHCQANLSN